METNEMIVSHSGHKMMANEQKQIQYFTTENSQWSAVQRNQNISVSLADSSVRADHQLL